MIKELTYEDVYKVTIETAKELMSKSFYYYNKTLPEVTPQSRLKEDLNIDSLDRIDFLLLVEDVYKVELIDEESKEEEKDNNPKPRAASTITVIVFLVHNSEKIA